MRLDRAALLLAGPLLAVAACATAALSGLGHRWGWWGYRQGFIILRWSAYVGAFGAAASLPVAVALRGAGSRVGLALALAGLVLGGGLCLWSWSLVRTARQVPPIHDITTDTASPPTFSPAILSLRAQGDNTAVYGGAALAEQQLRAYPDVAPLLLDVSPGIAFRRALAAARRLGWTVVAQDEVAGHIEAFDRTFWYGFFDDVVVRILPAGAGSRVDVRSASRVGKSDVGANARRVRRFLRLVARGAG